MHTMRMQSLIVLLALNAPACVSVRAGDYLKTRRALLRSVEKQATQAERLDGLKSAVYAGNLADAASLLMGVQVLRFSFVT